MRCELCGNRRHPLPAYALGWLCEMACRAWPIRIGVQPTWLLARSGDYAFDMRQCRPCALTEADNA